MKIKTQIFNLILFVPFLFIACSSSSPRFTDKDIKPDTLFVLDKNDTPNPLRIEITNELVKTTLFVTPDTVTVEKKEEYIILKTVEGIASYYAHKFHGRKTANGEIFNMNDLTAAHKTYPFGTLIRVTNMRNDSSVIVRINDRGPFIKGRIIDVSYEAAKILDMLPTGTAKVRLEILKWGE